MHGSQISSPRERAKTAAASTWSRSDVRWVVRSSRNISIHTNHDDSVSYGQGGPSASDATPLADLEEARKPAPVLIRATDGKSGEKRKQRIKLSTVVEPEALEGFFARYADVCKTGMVALKPRDKSKKKAKAKKRRGAAPVGGS